MGQQRVDVVNNHDVVTGTIEWPTIKNTRITLFDLMDLLKQGLPPQVVAHWYDLTTAEIDAVMQFMKAYEAEIEQSYATANARAAAQRGYWEAKNRDVLARDFHHLPPPPNADARWFALREKLITARKKLVEQLNGTHADPH
jgi:uncharacterized protein (DUF433 family)